MTKYKLGKFAGLNLSARSSAITGSILLFAALLGLSMGVLRLMVVEAILGSMAAVLLHWVASFAHQLGHAWAARRTGYPMWGIHFGPLGLLSASLYPRDEPDLPANIHIRRALGGPTGSLLASLLAGGIALLLRNSGGTPWWLALFFFLDSFLVFTLGPFLPLGFTDGSTLLHWWGKR
jgi:hypothetical protein